jgi:hypothetical protein
MPSQTQARLRTCRRLQMIRRLQLLRLSLCLRNIHWAPVWAEQDLLNRTLETLSEIAKRVGLLSLFSPNETLEDISTRNLPFLFVSYVLAEVENRVRTNGRQERLARIRSIEVHCVVSVIMSTIHSAFTSRTTTVLSTMRFTPTRLSQNRCVRSTPRSQQKLRIPQNEESSRSSNTSRRKSSGVR